MPQALKLQLLLLLAIAASSPSTAPRPATAASTTEFQATVLSIGDGDTIRVSRQGLPITIRLACIDAPEMAQSPYGQQSRRYLQTRLVKGQEVTILPHTIDRYGRTVAGDLRPQHQPDHGGRWPGLRLSPYLSGCNAKEYLDAEYRASRHRYGVWQVEGGITRPWDFRHGRTANVIPDGTTPGGRRYRCKEIASYARAQELLHQGHTYLDSNGDGEACESLKH